MKQATDLIIVGAGLSGLITAWRCLDEHETLNVTVIDAKKVMAGDHTWSFNMSDILPHLQDWMQPFIAHSWPQYDVKFPKHNRTLDIQYCTGNSETLRACIQPLVDSGRLTLKLGSKVETLNATQVTLASGETLEAKCVCDARGFKANPSVITGYQKFVGYTIKTKAPHGLKNPILMDATVEQIDGYRFVYCLPFSDTEMLVEDTYYSDSSDLAQADIEPRIDSYIKAQGWIEYEITRTETGVLPITLAVEQSHGEDVSEETTGPALLGMRGGYYHAVTGYSTPEAFKSANVVSEMITKGWPEFGDAVRHEMAYHRMDHYHEENFLRLLNRMMFRAAEPHQRYKVLQRFYSLPQDLIERFYRNRISKSDKLRILIGKPPVSISKAMKNLNETAFITREK